MIEKLKRPVKIGGTTFREKINELVDAVNKILAVQEQYATIYNEDIVPMLTPENKEPADQYAEQRKWIGKACWFWDGGAKTKAFGKLNQVDTEYNDAPFQTNFGQWYEHCEPVKPDDDIIYKGGDNE